MIYVTSVIILISAVAWHVAAKRFWLAVVGSALTSGIAIFVMFINSYARMGVDLLIDVIGWLAISAAISAAVGKLVRKHGKEKAAT